MKNLQPHTFNPNNCRDEWRAYSALLHSKPTLSERNDILPFFKDRKDLSLLICSYFPRYGKPDHFAHEYELDGDFVADLVVGDSAAENFLLVEFEDGAPDSIFKTKGKKATPDWTQRFEGAYSQLIDWLWKLEDKRSTEVASVFRTRV